MAVAMLRSRLLSQPALRSDMCRTLSFAAAHPHGASSLMTGALTAPSAPSFHASSPASVRPLVKISFPSPALRSDIVVVAPLAIQKRDKAQLRDPERPKRPASPWLQFLADFRTQERAKSLSHKEIMPTAAKEWKALSPDARRRFEEPYEMQKKRYDALFKEYTESGKKDAWKRDPAKPKKPLTGYFLFLQDFPPHPELKLTERTKLAGQEWKKMSVEAKKPYVQKAADAKTAYEKSMKAYKASGKEEAWKEKVGIAATEAKRKRRREHQADAKKAKAAAAKKEKQAKAKATKAAADAKRAAKKLAANTKAPAAKKEKQAKAKATKAAADAKRAAKKLAANTKAPAKKAQAGQAATKAKAAEATK
eukprot:CAMPEP_0170639058 /NCGR_PEP_ID=MMETSP0224-20130122/39420_1 /TAXON_ID=285029 /ORGANISM="Togula jolla, Strain CCCM 725" /LENGTH=364 /DNA_ID=CAMNT_0010969335 /DNA_START=26 /DNA_END=1120 /DNA_ORIENTATION=+